MSVRQYTFQTSSDANLWDAVRRLADEVGWRVEAETDAMKRLKTLHINARASRRLTTRAEFIRGLLREAGVDGVKIEAA
jgi:uncharacterized lipoprotein